MGGDQGRRRWNPGREEHIGRRAAQDRRLPRARRVLRRRAEVFRLAVHPYAAGRRHRRQARGETWSGAPRRTRSRGSRSTRRRRPQRNVVSRNAAGDTGAAGPRNEQPLSRVTGCVNMTQRERLSLVAARLGAAVANDLRKALMKRTRMRQSFVAFLYTYARRIIAS